MIYLDMAGRLGNQLFRYSFARNIQEKCGDELVIDFSRVYSKGLAKNGWKNSLKGFNTYTYIEKNNCFKDVFKKFTFTQKILFIYFKIVSKLLKKNRRLLKKFQLSMQPIMNKNNLYFLELGYYNYDYKYLKNNKVKYVCGCFECEKYFNDIKKIIQSEITPKSSEIHEQELLKIINNAKNSVCVSVRRGDFVSNPKNKKMYDVCTIDYYVKSIKFLKSKFNYPTFIMFSDDIQWVKDNIKVPDTVFYYESGKSSVEEKLKLMSSCNHFIISNSTFSWWAQFLSTNLDKVVISPTKWYNNGLDSDLISDDWIKISGDKDEE